MIGSKLSEVYRDLISVALGNEKADLLIENCQIVDVATGEIFDGSIAVKHDRIAALGDNIQAKSVFDAKGMYAVPGYIDAHAHPDYYLTLTEFANVAVRHGTTSVFAEPDAALNSMGKDGFELFVRWAKECSLRVYMLLPFISPQDLSLEMSNFDVDYGELVKIADGDILGMGEAVAWSAILNNEGWAYEKLDFFLERNLKILGHTAGMRKTKLQAYSTFSNSCHEAISQDQLLERMRYGMHVMVREGSIRSDIEILRGLDEKVDRSWISIVSDGIEPAELEKGYMDMLARKAVEIGVDEIDALRMITWNPARFYGRDMEVGILAPGRYADVVLLKDLWKFSPEVVFVGGKIPEKKRTSGEKFSVMNVEKVGEEEIALPEGTHRVRAMELLSETVNRMKITEIEAENGRLIKHSKAVLVDRFHGGKPVVGIISDLEFEGAVASTVTFDEYNIIAIGMDDGEISEVINRLIKIGGGIVYNGNESIELFLPYGGVMGDNSSEIADKMRKLRDTLRDAGLRFENPLNVLHFMSFVTLPELKLSNKGLVDVKQRRIVDLFPE